MYVCVCCVCPYLYVFVHPQDPTTAIGQLDGVSGRRDIACMCVCCVCPYLYVFVHPRDPATAIGQLDGVSGRRGGGGGRSRGEVA